MNNLVGTRLVTLIHKITGEGFAAFRIPDAGADETPEHILLVNAYLSNLTTFPWEGDDSGLSLNVSKDVWKTGGPGDFILFSFIGPNKDILNADIIPKSDVGTPQQSKRFWSPDL